MIVDRIFLRGIVLFAYHGVFEEEASLGQRFEIDVDCMADTRSYSGTDNQHEAVRYDHVYEAVRHTVCDGPRVGLIETLGENIAKAILDQFAMVEEVRVEIRKPGAPVPGAFQTIGIEIVRRRSE